MSLNDLATELLTKIFLYLDSNSSWVPLALCSKRLHGIVEPLLYSKIRLVKSQQSYLIYICSISANPHLVKYARHFQTFVEPYGWQYDMQPLGTEQRAWMRQTLPDHIYGKAVCDEWFGQIFSQPEVYINTQLYDAITAFLLNLFRHTLESIDLRFLWHNKYDYPHISRVLEQALLEQSTKCSEASLSRLRSVALRQMDWVNPRDGYEGDGIPCRVFMPFLTLPSVRKFWSLKLCSDDPLSFHNSTQSSIIELRVNEALMKTTAISPFLSMFRKLRRVEYQHANLSHPFMPRFLSKEFMNGLLHSKSTLEELIVSNYPHCRVVGPGKPASWVAFTKLRSITADFSILAGVDRIVPPNPQPEGTANASNYPTAFDFLSPETDIDTSSDTESQAVIEMVPRQYKPEESIAFASYFPPSLEHLTILKCRSSVFDLVDELLSPANPNFPCHLETLHLIFAQNRRKVPKVRWDNAQKQASLRGVQISWSMLNFENRATVDGIMGRNSRFENFNRCS